MTGLFVRIFIIVFGCMFFLYLYIAKLNALTELRLAIPKLERELRQLEEDNTRLQYEVDRFESPQNLMLLLRRPEFGHLHHPLANQVVILEEE